MISGCSQTAAVYRFPSRVPDRKDAGQQRAGHRPPLKFTSHCLFKSIETGGKINLCLPQYPSSMSWFVGPIASNPPARKCVPPMPPGRLPCSCLGKNVRRYEGRSNHQPSDEIKRIPGQARGWTEADGHAARYAAFRCSGSAQTPRGGGFRGHDASLPNPL